MGRYWSEKYQLGILTEFLKQKGIQYSTEATIYSLRVDLVGVQRDRTLAIEMKSKDFQRGIKQAERNQSFVDYSFLSMWEENIPQDAVSQLENSNIGLLSINSNVQCLSSPSICNSSDHAKDRVKQQVIEDV